MIVTPAPTATVVNKSPTQGIQYKNHHPQRLNPLTVHRTLDHSSKQLSEPKQTNKSSRAWVRKADGRYGQTGEPQ